MIVNKWEINSCDIFVVTSTCVFQSHCSSADDIISNNGDSCVGDDDNYNDDVDVDEFDDDVNTSYNNKNKTNWLWWRW